MIKIIILLLAMLVTSCDSTVDESKIPLTEDELAYIATHPSVVWAVEDNRPPYVFIEGGNPTGLAPEYLDLIAKKTGLKFRAARVSSFNTGAEALRDGKVDIMSAVRPTTEHAEFMGFTPPFIYQGGVFVFRLNSLPRSPLSAGITKDNAAKSYLEIRFPDMRIVETEDDEQAIALLQKGLLDGVVTDASTASYFSKKGGVPIRLAIINFDYPYCFAFRKNDTVLGSILTKAISSITPEDKAALNSKWLD